ncbi:MAG: thermonuclease family protein [Chloroflexota bacterium]
MSILTKASDLIKSGEKNKASSLLVRHLKARPQDEQAWLLLTFCVESKEQQIKYLKKVLSINPDNKKAHQILARLKNHKPNRKTNMRKLSRIAIVLMFGLAFPLVSVAGAGLVFQQDILDYLTLSPTSIQQEPSNQILGGSVSLVEDRDTEQAFQEEGRETIDIDYQNEQTLTLPIIPTAYCVPANAQVEEGKVIRVTDSQSLEVEIADSTVQVRYLGIETPAIDEHLAQYALEVNQTLQGRTVLLASDGPNENEAGELLRYVFSGEYFINYQLIMMGLAVTPEFQSGLACDGFFLAARDMAEEQQVGVWEWIDVRMDPKEWETWPVVPLISDNAKEIYLASIASGHAAGHFSILGDCQAPQWKLFGSFDSQSLNIPAELVYLKPSMEKYAGQWGRNSITVKSGNTVASLYSVYWADPAFCGPAESAIECELRANNPSVALIMLGTNWGNGKDADFDRRMRETVEYLIARNVLPIIVNKADPANPYVREFPLNRIMAQIAYDYDIPLWNFWASVQHLYNGGIDPNDPYMIHLNDDAFKIKRWDGLQTLHVLHEAVYGE